MAEPRLPQSDDADREDCSLDPGDDGCVPMLVALGRFGRLHLVVSEGRQIGVVGIAPLHDADRIETLWAGDALSRGQVLIGDRLGGEEAGLRAD